ncbi:carboxymuconolactone decarboxylase family protein [Acinetobacter gerneri]|uniref:4-carboxymuconolactone decarboxylase n=1 Tax=Acinetobacter gerneri DSM 14967 = CIP 107464 = MTCC 9824 TaxID=1120926 RepID=N8ZPL9_9GAMM|nr:carboxymuconolactone decarboxylase family protein [Acinetobacter gerneri]ENV33703.1 4-carboxymuconolactone decarboxylase [Acinetobacter gerneri DSM 14967 = CIP 107464 = MTCC 9824]EPR82207.1 4-carboxymuconolactone decarboxylase [Acinetobacter gerneri DSM 14967 = CIP 107464 = MTCC 9824]
MGSEKYMQGLKIRKQVLGEEYVNQAIQNMDEFSGPLQQLVTEYCWGTIWSDETLSLQQRSLINIAMISALNRPNELKLHIKGGLRNGLSKEQIRATLMQVAIYCGVPAAVDSFKLAKQAFLEFEEQG